MNFSKWVIAYIIFIGAATGNAAPFPSTSSSAVWQYITQAPERNGFEFLGDQKFLEKLGWSIIPAQLQDKEHVLSFENGAAKSLLSVRVDHLPESQAQTTLQKYVETWLKEYPRFGFEVTETKYFNHAAGLAFQTDFFSQNRKLRQVVFLKNATAIIFTCSNTPEGFEGVAKNCDEVVKQFRWK